MKETRIVLLCFLVFAANLSAQKILLINGFVHPVKGDEVSSSLIGIESGKISFIKNAITNTYNPKEWDTIINCEGQHIYPGMVAPNSTLGLTEIDAVRATRDYNDVGDFNPHVRSQIAFNAESKVLETVKTNGVLIIQASPRGGYISGSSSLMYAGGWNWEDATILKDDGIHVNWPSPSAGGGWWAEPEAKTVNSQYAKESKTINDFFSLAQNYARTENPQSDIRLEAMKPCFSGSKRVFFHANELQQIVDIIEFAQKYKLKFPVIIGGNDAPLVGQRLVDAKIPIMVKRLHELPEHDEDPINDPFTLPYRLLKLGIKFCLQNEGGMEAMQARNIPFLAGTAMAYGLSEDEALRSVTLSTCEILGIEKDFGSIEVGKSATLFVSKGSPLDMKSNDITCIVMGGKIQSCDNFQSQLYRKYQKKYAEPKR